MEVSELSESTSHDSASIPLDHQPRYTDSDLCSDIQPWSMQQYFATHGIFETANPAVQQQYLATNITHQPLSDVSGPGSIPSQVAQVTWSPEHVVEYSILSTFDMRPSDYNLDSMDWAPTAPTPNNASANYAFQAMDSTQTSSTTNTGSSQNPVISAIQSKGDPPNPSQYKPYAPKSKRRQRGSKAPTMSDVSWEPAADRIRHLWVVEKNDSSQIRNIINEEFGLNAT